MGKQLSALLFTCVLSACGNPARETLTESERSDPGVIGPNLSVGEWQAASPEAQAAYFRGAVSMHIAEPAQNEAQRRFDDDLALDLRDCESRSKLKTAELRRASLYAH